jgi:hypothetical protein
MLIVFWRGRAFEVLAKALRRKENAKNAWRVGVAPSLADAVYSLSGYFSSLRISLRLCGFARDLSQS